MNTKETLISLEQTFTHTVDKTIQEQPQLVRGVIEHWEKEHGSVIVEGRTLQARMAVSCVIEPQPQDVVLLCVLGQQAYILALLERYQNPQEAKIAVPGAKSILFRSDERIDIDIKEGHISLGHLELFTGSMFQTGRRIITQGEEVISIANHKVENVHNRTVSISGVDLRKANEVQDDIKGTWMIRAKVYVKKVAEDIRIIAKRVLFS